MEFTLDTTALGIIVAGSIAIGLIVGLMAGLLMRGEEEKPPRRGLVSVLHLWRHKRDGALWLQLDETVAASMDDLPPEERETVTRLADEWYRWLKVVPAPTVPEPPAPPASPSPPPVMASETPAVKPAPVQPLPKVETPEISRNPLKPFQQAFQQRKPVEKTSPASIAAQVDEILQEMLEGTPLEKRGIRLMELPGQGMVVLVGVEKFTTVDEVPYDDVRKAIKIAVARWEAHNERKAR